MFEKSASELKQKLLKCKQTIQIATFNVRTLNRIGQLSELTASAVEHKIDVICIQEHRYTHTEDIKYHETGIDGVFPCRYSHQHPSISSFVILDIFGVRVSVLLYATFLNLLICLFLSVCLSVLVWLAGWLVGLLSYINPCRSFNAKSNFYTNNQFYFKQFSLE